jgi:hypothetical protein
VGSFVRAVLLATVVGLALGTAGQMGPELHPALHWVVALGVPWLVAAFVAGALVGDRGRGALAGAVALVFGTLVYYANRVGFGAGAIDGISVPLRGAPVVVGWCAAAAGGGALFGLLGAWWRRGSPLAEVAGTAVISGALVGEALLLTHEWSGRAAQLVLTAELAAGAGLPFLLTRRHRLLVPALILTAVVALAVAVTENSVRDALRGVGWRGA